MNDGYRDMALVLRPVARLPGGGVRTNPSLPLPLSFPLPFPSPPLPFEVGPLPLPLEVGPLNPARGSGGAL